VRRQLSAVECGAACLAIVLTYFGRPTSVAECRERCDAGRDGLSARTILEAARSYGLSGAGYAMDVAGIAQLPEPAILHWGFNHFVVFERWSRGRIEIVDPALGRRRVSLAEFGQLCTGVVLVLRPGTEFDASGAGRRPVRNYLLRTARTGGVRSVVGQVLLASVLLTGLGLLPPLFTKVLVDEVLPGGRPSALTVLAVGAALIGLSYLLVTYLRSLLVLALRAKLDTALMLEFFRHTLSLPFGFFQRRSSGDLLMRLSSNTNVRELLTTQAVGIVLDGVLAVVYAAILLVVAPVLAALALAVAAVQVAVLAVTTRPMHRLTQRELEAQADSQGYLVEALAGISTVKASGGEARAFQHWSRLFLDELRWSVRAGHLTAVVNAITVALRSVTPLLLLLVGAAAVLDGSTSLGTMLALLAVATQFIAPLSSLVAQVQQLQVTGAYLERLTDVIEAEPEQAGRRTRPAPRLEGRVDVRGVSFRYDGSSRWALREVSFSIEPGQTVALVGSTGSGKSTLAALLLGLFEPTRGEIRYDGESMADLDYGTLRAQFGSVLQDTSVFSGSIRQNISFNNPDASTEQIVEAARIAAIHDDVRAMPMRFETRIAEGGTALSGGQRQRLAIARAVVARPALLVLDEATSHLDAMTEAVVTRNIRQLNCTRVIIAHRLSTIRDADLVVVLDNGEVVEQGTHHGLLCAGGRYTELLRGQLAGTSTPR
jgi:ABC-type bacteriocin/lantibiotic exporter with double-glycine peptidase domain